MSVLVTAVGGVDVTGVGSVVCGVCVVVGEQEEGIDCGTHVEFVGELAEDELDVSYSTVHVMRGRADELL